MKSLKDFEEDLYKCSRCGLCQSVCPVYQVTKNETLLARGRFSILSGICSGKLNFDKKTVENLDLCLNCNACKNFCPSGIDAREIFVSAKNSTKKTYYKKFLNLYFFFKIKMSFFSFGAKIYRTLGFDKLLDLALNLSVSSYIPFKFELKFINSVLKNKHSLKKFSLDNKKKGNVAFFEGCFNKYINNSSEKASINLIKSLGYDVELIKSECCSISLLYAGNFDEFKANALKIIAASPKDVDYIVCDCDSCVSVLKSYSKYFDEAQNFSKKIISLSEFLLKSNFIRTPESNNLVSYHKPCHSDEFSEKLIENLMKKTYVPLNNKNQCCGFSGDFALKHINIASKVALNKADDVIYTKCSTIVTSCPACIMGLNLGLSLRKSDVKVQSIAEFLDS